RPQPHPSHLIKRVSVMGKKKKPVIPDEHHLALPLHPQFLDKAHATPIVDTHTHLLPTFSKYRGLYPGAKYNDVFSFVKGFYGTAAGEEKKAVQQKIDAIIDVWCDAPVPKDWKVLADSALSEDDRRDKWGGVNYWFVMGECFYLFVVYLWIRLF